VVGEQRVQEGTKHATLRVPRGGCVVAKPHHMGADRQDVQEPVADEGVLSQGPEISDEVGGHYSVERRCSQFLLSRWERALWSAIEIASSVDRPKRERLASRRTPSQL
jgi:hypothetical protein